MNRFAYEGVRLGGEAVRGEVEARSMAEVKTMAWKQGVAVRRVRKVKTRKVRLPLVDLARVTREFAVMLAAGLPVVEALTLVSEGARRPQEQAVLEDLAERVAGGSSVAEAMRTGAARFPDLYLALVAAGEHSGTFDTMLLRIADMLERSLALRAKVRKALVYPCIVVVVAFLVMAVMLLFVVPMMEDVFVGFGAELPAFTRLVLDLSEGLARRWWQIVIALVTITLLCRWLLKRFDHIAYACDRLLLRMPLVGKLLRESAMARLCETLATSFAAGTPLIDSLAMLGDSVGNRVLVSALMRVRERVSQGELLHRAMRESSEFPTLVAQMVRIGEESGTLDTMLARAAAHYRDSVDELADGLSEALGPVVMMVLAVVVGGLLVAMYLPIFSLGSAFNG
ncbi:MAG: type II secretion system F family protein [Gammaproteobacteria bacterium]|nr:type II secretion system F family protein [Gammaproteobacteria bacterium]MCY4276823.1 type II secretion system F family protein [Gammaproteobacteria bacterium]MCY4324249.1 type II secretion system F family protein [Gammaproteobacteria bacterium]